MTTDTKKRVKRKPPVKRQPVKKDDVTDTVTKYDLVPKRKPTRSKDLGKNSWLRRVAGLKYVTSQTSTTIRQLAEDPEFKGVVTLKTLLVWSMEDDWTGQRKRYYDSISEAIKKQISTRQVKSRVVQLKALDEIAAKMHEKLIKDLADPGTYEGVAGAYIKALTLSENLRAKIINEIIPDSLVGGLGSDSAQIVPVVTEDEAMEAALAIIKKRREASKLVTEKDKEDNG